MAPGQKDLTEEEALAKAQEIRQKIVEGADFAAIARVDSDDMGSSAKGGDLGIRRHGQTVPSFEEALFALKDGELSQPVKITVRLPPDQGRGEGSLPGRSKSCARNWRRPWRTKPVANSWPS